MVRQVRMSLWRSQHCINVEYHVKFKCMSTFCLNFCKCSGLKRYPPASEISPLLCEPSSVLSQGSDPTSCKKAYVILFNIHIWRKSRGPLNGWILYEPDPLLLCLSNICIGGSHNARTDGNEDFFLVMTFADFNPCDARLNFRTHKCIHTFSIIFQGCNGAGNWNPSFHGIDLVTCYILVSAPEEWLVLSIWFIWD